MKNNIKKLLVLSFVCFLAAVVFISCDGDANVTNDEETQDLTNETQAEAHTHTYSEWIESKKATCTEDGIKERDCKCGDIQTAVIYATGHTETTVIEKEATCAAEGVKKIKCSVCEAEISSEEIPKIAHTETSVTEKEATCAEKGSKKIKCSVCDEFLRTEDIAVTDEHVFGEETVLTEATCTASGSKKMTCTICGKEETKEIPALGHNTNSTNTCTRCGLVTLNMTDKEKTEAEQVELVSYSVVEYSDEIKINIKFLDADEYKVYAPAYVDVKIVDANGVTLYDETLVISSSQSSISIDHDKISTSYTAKGTIYYTIHNDGYFEFDQFCSELEELPWTVNVELPELPSTIASYTWDDKISSSYSVTDVTFKVSDNDITFYFAGEKTYDREGANYSSTCRIGWKLYDSEGFVVASGTCYTNSLKTGDKFRDEYDTSYNCIKEGETYRLEIMSVG